MRQIFIALFFFTSSIGHTFTATPTTLQDFMDNLSAIRARTIEYAEIAEKKGNSYSRDVLDVLRLTPINITPKPTSYRARLYFSVFFGKLTPEEIHVSRNPYFFYPLNKHYALNVYFPAVLLHEASHWARYVVSKKGEHYEGAAEGDHDAVFAKICNSVLKDAGLPSPFESDCVTINQSVLANSYPVQTLKETDKEFIFWSHPFIDAFGKNFSALSVAKDRVVRVNGVPIRASKNTLFIVPQKENLNLDIATNQDLEALGLMAMLDFLSVATLLPGAKLELPRGSSIQIGDRGCEIMDLRFYPSSAKVRSLLAWDESRDKIYEKCDARLVSRSGSMPIDSIAFDNDGDLLKVSFRTSSSFTFPANILNNKFHEDVSVEGDMIVTAYPDAKDYHELSFTCLESTGTDCTVATPRKKHRIRSGSYNHIKIR